MKIQLGQPVLQDGVFLRVPIALSCHGDKGMESDVFSCDIDRAMVPKNINEIAFAYAIAIDHLILLAKAIGAQVNILMTIKSGENDV